MQKKLIALAVAGLLSAPAFAQSNVTLYGTIDYGYVSLGSNYEKDVKSRNALESGVSKANRIGVKGVEDLGNGLKAVFVLENGMTGDNTGGVAKSSNTGFFNGVNRQSYAGLAGAFGTVAFGRQYTPQHLFTASVDPFGKQGLGGAGNVLFQDRRLNNLAAYISPDWGGFKFIAGYTFAGAPLSTFGGAVLGTKDENIENNNDVRVWAFAPSFTWNNLFVGANYHSAKLNRDNDAGGVGRKGISALNSIDLFASYDFGIVKVGSAIGRRTTKKDAINALAGAPVADKDGKITQWMIGATFRITPSDSIMTSYSRTSENKLYNNSDKVRINQFAVGYEHALSKRTALYSQFSMIGRNNAVKDGGWFSTVGDTGDVGDVMASVANGASGMDYRRGFTVGMRHDF